jgi:hypothetical protein
MLFIIMMTVEMGGGKGPLPPHGAASLRRYLGGCGRPEGAGTGNGHLNQRF